MTGGYAPISALYNLSGKSARLGPFQNSQFLFANKNKFSSQGQMVPADGLRDRMTFRCGCLNGLTQTVRALLSAFSSVPPVKC
jgi:hypothetical protein